MSECEDMRGIDARELSRIDALESDELREDEHEDIIELALMLGRALLESVTVFTVCI